MSGSAHEASRALWGEMAHGWETLHDVIWSASADVGRAMVERLDPQPGDAIVDIAAGPGDTGFLAAERIGPNGSLLSTDFAPEMVEVASRASASMPNVECRVLDAQAMDLPSASFDGALCRWGFMLMLEPQTALAETRRVLKPGGRLVYAVWGAPEHNAWIWLPGKIAVEHGWLQPVDMRAPGGMFSMDDADVNRKMVEAAGFDTARVEPLDLTWTLEGFDGLWRFYTELAGAVANLLKRLPPEDVETFQGALQERFEEFRTGDAYELTAQTVVVTAS